MAQIWFQNRSIEFEVVRLDRCCCPIALTIAVQNPLSHLFWRLHAITNYNLNVSHSTRFLHFLSNSQVSPKFKDSMLRAPFTHKAQIRCVSDVLVSGWLLSCTAFCSDTRVHNLL